MNKDITLEEYTNKFNRIFADKEENGFSQEELTPLWKSLQNDDMDITFDDDQHRLVNSRIKSKNIIILDTNLQLNQGISCNIYK
jgi:hypothetical protein